MSDVLSELAAQAPADPDAQATVTDFLDYTEYLPSDLTRSLTLIRKLDEDYIRSSARVHGLAKIYGALPSVPAHARLDPQSLRSEMSGQLARALDMRGSAFVEASRLYDVVDHHYTRLASILSKLQAMPQPPSREASPAARPSASPQTQRARNTRQVVDADAPAPRITLRLDGARSSGAGGRSTAQASRRKAGGRRVTVPGEVLPPLDRDSAASSSGSDWESAPPSPVPTATARVGAPARAARTTPGANRPLKAPKAGKPNAPKSGRGHAQAGSSGPGGKPAERVAKPKPIPVPAADLKPPPPNAVPGSEDAPWLKLTPWEMAKLRKRMKKNAVWCPSETMIRRELAELGRGPEAYHAAKAKAEATGQALVDDSNIEARLSQPGKRALAEGEISAESLSRDEMQLSNRGMKLNEAKKLKKENMQREAAAQAAAEAEAARRGVTTGQELKSEQKEDAGTTNDTARPSSKDSKKRKRDSSPLVEVEQTNDQASKSKKRKPDGPASTSIAHKPTATTTTTTTVVPLAAPGPSNDVPPADQVSSEAPRPSSSSNRRRASAPSKTETPERASTRPRSRGTTTPAEQAFTAGKDRPRRASTISAAAAEAAQPVRPTPRRSKRPVPGRLTGDGGDGPAVTVGQRTAAPRKKNGAKRPKSEAQGVEERVDDGDEENYPVDPDEPRYCFCGDVSFGQMIQCENNDVSFSMPLSIFLITSLWRPYRLTFWGLYSAKESGSTSNASVLPRCRDERLNGTALSVARSWASVERLNSLPGPRRDSCTMTRVELF